MSQSNYIKEIIVLNDFTNKSFEKMAVSDYIQAQGK